MSARPSREELDAAVPLSVKPSSADETALDDLFQQALSAAERGEGMELERWLVGREHLAAQARETAALAREVAVHVDRVPAAPRSIAGYEIVRELGRGSMGAVFLARQLALGGRPVALKVLPAAAALSPHGRKRFLTEARALARVRHPNVVSVHDVVEEGDVCAYAMEWIEGGSLAELVRELKGHRPLEEAARALGLDARAFAGAPATAWLVRATASLARALADVHRAGLLHRDIKPSNVLIGRDGAPRLSDFGLAHEVDSEHVTRTGHYLGTPSYSSPEQLRGDQAAIDARSDVYSLAATLYEALTGRVPHAGRSPAEILASAESGAFASARSLAHGLPRDLDTILATALDPSPARRYASADAFADDLERLLALQPIVARPASRLSRGVKWTRRNRAALVPSFAAALVVAILAVALGRWALDRARADERAREKLVEAQQALLDPFYANELYYVASDEKPLESDIGQGPTSVGERTARALELYETALGFAPHEPLAMQIALERDTVCLAASVASGRIEASAPLRARCPLTVEHAESRALDRAGSAWSEAELAACSGEDRRHLGLLAFLLGDARLSIAALRSAALALPADPLADASLGMLLMEEEEPGLAAPLLHSACDAYASAGFLVVALADATVANAVGSGRLEQLEAAERLLDRAAELPLDNTFESDQRVRADIAAARGEVEKAGELYASLARRHSGVTLFRHYVRFLADQGRLAEALVVQRAQAAGRPGSRELRQEFLDLAERWWAEECAGGELEALRRCLEPRSAPYFSLADLLRWVRESAALAEVQDSMPPKPAASSPAPRTANLLALANRLELTDMDLARFQSLPNFLKDIQSRAWHGGVPLAFTRAIVATADNLCHLLRVTWRAATHPRLASAAVLFAGASVASAASGDWVSQHNGPTNQSKADGEYFAGNWIEVWRSPWNLPRPLVKDGIVYFQDDASQPHRFVGVDVATGAIVWGPVTVGAGNEHKYMGCIAGDRLVLPISEDGQTHSGVQMEIQVWDLTQPAPTAPLSQWAAGAPGTIQSLQCVDTSVGPRIIAYTVDTQDGVPCLWRGRVRVFDYNCTQVCVTGCAPSGEDTWAPSAPAIFSGASGWTALVHETRKVSGTFNRASIRVRVVDADSPTCAEPVSPFASNPALSGTTNAPTSSQTWQNFSESIIVDPTEARAYLVETSGKLRAYDLNSGLPSYTRTTSSASGHHMMTLALVAASDLLLVLDPTSVAQNQYHVYAFTASSGAQRFGSPLVVSKSPSLAAVMEQGVALLNLGGTEIRPLYSSGVLGDAVKDVNGQVVAGYVRAVVDGHYLVERGAELIAYKSDCSSTSFCSAKVNSLGCTPAISSVGAPTLTGLDGFHIRASQVPGQTSGTLLWSLSKNPPTSGSGIGAISPSRWGTRVCLFGAQRAGAAASGGTAGACDGVLDFHFSQSFMNAQGLTAGTTVYVQFVYSDPNHPDGSGLGHSDALEFRICP